MGQDVGCASFVYSVRHPLGFFLTGCEPGAETNDDCTWRHSRRNVRWKDHFAFVIEDVYFVAIKNSSLAGIRDRQPNCVAEFITEPGIIILGTMLAEMLMRRDDRKGICSSLFREGTIRRHFPLRHGRNFSGYASPKVSSHDCTPGKFWIAERAGNKLNLS